jgi:hypothetical protein
MKLTTYGQYNSTNHVALHAVTGRMEIKAVGLYDTIIKILIWLTAGIILLTVLLTIQAIQFIQFIKTGEGNGCIIVIFMCIFIALALPKT